ncbi:MAG: hypothetical protein QXR69_04045, partial [Conexivisphaerales archaeon]
KPEIVVRKSLMPELPDTFKESMLGYPHGSIKQYRDDTGVHVREYKDKFVIHIDRVDPRKSLLGHLVSDSPETILQLFFFIPITCSILRFFKRLIF